MTKPSRVGHLAVLLGLMLGGISIGSLAFPDNVLACYCAPGPMSDYVADPEVVVLVGTVVAPPGSKQEYLDHGTFEISRVFKGTGLAASMPIDSDGSSCGLPIRAERHEMLLVTRVESGRLVPSVCLPAATIGSEGAQVLLDETVAAFGPGFGPEPPTAVPSQAAVDGVALGLVLVAAALAFAAAVFAVVVIVRRRMPT